MTEPRQTIDVAHLPTFGFGTTVPIWWGNMAFMVIEALGFVFAIATYLYLYNHNHSWPLGPQPGLLWPSLLLALFFVSEIPNIALKRAANRRDLRGIRRLLPVMCLFSFGALILRALEFTTLNIRWDENAYGSILWFILGLHTAHMVTDFVETIVIAVLVRIGPIDVHRFQDVEDNQDYWHFIVWFWPVLYAVLYWLPRWFAVPA